MGSWEIMAQAELLVTLLRILGKLFYIGGVLSSYTVTEMQGNQKVKDAERGILLVNIDEEDPIQPKTLERIMSVMDEEETSVIFAGSSQALNRYMKANNELYKRFSARLQFDDLTCDELALLLLRKANDTSEDNRGACELDDSCTSDNIAQVIAATTPENLRSVLNAHLLDQMIIEAKKCALRSGEEATTISLRDLGIGIEKGAQIYKSLLNL